MNKIFNKLNGILFAGMMGGILVAGLGGGIAFAEYMDFEYDESVLIEGDGHEVEEITYEMADGERVYAPASSLKVNESIPQGTVMLSVEYDSHSMAITHTIGSFQDATLIEVYAANTTNDFERFLNNKDVVLQGLKEGKIVALPGDYYFNTEVSVNPADKDRVFISYDEYMRSL